MTSLATRTPSVRRVSLVKARPPRGVAPACKPPGLLWVPLFRRRSVLGMFCLAQTVMWPEMSASTRILCHSGQSSPRKHAQIMVATGFNANGGRRRLLSAAGMLDGGAGPFVGRMVQLVDNLIERVFPAIAAQGTLRLSDRHRDFRLRRINADGTVEMVAGHRPFLDVLSGDPRHGSRRGNRARLAGRRSVLFLQLVFFPSGSRMGRDQFRDDRCSW